jgi:hypothetical protein
MYYNARFRCAGCVGLIGLSTLSFCQECPCPHGGYYRSTLAPEFPDDSDQRPGEPNPLTLRQVVPTTGSISSIMGRPPA